MDKIIFQPTKLGKRAKQILDLMYCAFCNKETGYSDHKTGWYVCKCCGNSQYKEYADARKKRSQNKNI